MSDGPLSTYLNDHLAGSVRAIAMVERAIEESAGTLLGRRLEEILKEIRKDQAVVQDLIQRVGSRENPLKKAGAWLTEKAGSPVLRDLDLDLLERRAVEQHDRVEEWRLEAAREAL